MADTHTMAAGTRTGGQGAAGGSMTGGSSMAGRGESERHSEGVVARTLEEQTAKLPSDVWLWAAGASIVGSLVLQCSGRKEESNFVGQWAPTFLILGLYNKIVKVAGSDRPSRGTGSSGGAFGAGV